jgi:hypothetical protein
MNENFGASENAGWRYQQTLLILALMKNARIVARPYAP